jgi:hypothetical protein
MTPSPCATTVALTATATATNSEKLKIGWADRKLNPLRTIEELNAVGVFQEGKLAFYRGSNR